MLRNALKRFRASIVRIYERPRLLGGGEDGPEFRSVPLPPPIDFGLDGGGAAVDPNRLDDVLADLANRIENLQRERVNFEKLPDFLFYFIILGPL